MTATVPSQSQTKTAPESTATPSELRDLLDRPARFSEETRKIILDTCCGGASSQEAQELIAIAELRGLNPLVGECYFVKRWDTVRQREVWAVQVSIDAMRIKAEETGLYLGQDEPEFEYSGADHTLPTLARVRVYRKDFPRPIIGVARYSEFVQKKKDGAPTRFWKDMPHNQLGKCAEAQALRKAFPKRFAQIYTPDEAGRDEAPTPGEALQEQLGRTTSAAQPTSETANESLFTQRIAAIAAAETLLDLSTAMKGARAGLSPEQVDRLALAASERKAVIVERQRAADAASTPASQADPGPSVSHPDSAVICTVCGKAVSGEAVATRTVDGSIRTRHQGCSPITAQAMATESPPPPPAALPTTTAAEHRAQAAKRDRGRKGEPEPPFGSHEQEKHAATAQEPPARNWDAESTAIWNEITAATSLDALDTLAEKVNAFEKDGAPANLMKAIHSHLKDSRAGKGG
jgi:phage recombination protein Bet